MLNDVQQVKIGVGDQNPQMTRVVDIQSGFVGTFANDQRPVERKVGLPARALTAGEAEQNDKKQTGAAGETGSNLVRRGFSIHHSSFYDIM
jgi:hypothetical protein